ncbi:MAG: polymer-forming cytoskeletal protein [Flavobacteriaceae bacterium]|jgi:cytoskeletal protein CcmA (bactofilin family)|nr:polymer-forming cytoskeletal protein [Flavobacteriaceae bacterium]
MRGTDNNGQYSKIDKNTIFKGSIHSKTDIRIDGTVEGEVVTTGKVIFGKDAKVKGTVLCGNADVEGTFDGELTVSGTLSLKTGSNLKGKVRIQKLIVESGATFNANCSMHSAEDGVKKLKKVNEKEEEAEPVANIL